jgi:hypothetical protein
MSVRQLMEADATRLAPAPVDLWPRIAGRLAAEQRRARRRRLAATSAIAALMAVAWMGVAPVGGWLPGAANTVVPTAQAAEATPAPIALTPVPAAVATPIAQPVAATAVSTATGTSTPLPSR